MEEKSKTNAKEEIEFFKKVVENSADLFYRYAKEGGLKLA